ncbi:MAG: cation:proton antiporter, partial [Pandoraea sp.]|nr:cation:proton antiporter [Pandoraea sp.]
ILVGILVGPAGLGALDTKYPWLYHVTISNPHSIEPFAEFGITLLLFSIGLELSLKRLWGMRGAVFGVLAATVAGAAAGLAALASLTISEASGACQCWRPATYPPVKATSTALATNVRVSFEVRMSLS